jgi:hypothetical protein
VRDLRVRRARSDLSFVRLVSWEDTRVTSGAFGTWDVVGGPLAELHGSRPFSGTACLATGLVEPVHVDAFTSGSWWVLARFVTPCGPCTFGQSAAPVPYRAVLDDVTLSPCP